MSDHAYERGRSQNLFLDSLTPTSPIHDVLAFETVAQGTPVAKAGDAVRSIYFPTTGVISNVVRMNDGTEVETSLVGRDGFFGVPVALGIEESVGDAMFQIAGDTWWASRLAFEKCLAIDPDLRARSMRFAHFTIASISQFTGCNRLHPLNERLARWLLMAQDRVRSAGVILTQEYLATMLGVRRPAVSLAAATLEKAGLIDYRRGHITIRDRSGLEDAACECYRTTSVLLERLMGYRLILAIDDGVPRI